MSKRLTVTLISRYGLTSNDLYGEWLVSDSGLDHDHAASDSVLSECVCWTFKHHKDHCTG